MNYWVYIIQVLDGSREGRVRVWNILNDAGIRCWEIYGKAEVQCMSESELNILETLEGCVVGKAYGEVQEISEGIYDGLPWYKAREEVDNAYSAQREEQDEA